MELLEAKSVATVLACSPRMIWKMKDAGTMPPPVRVGRLVRWRREDIENWVREGCPSCRPAPAGPRSRGSASPLSSSHR